MREIFGGIGPMTVYGDEITMCDVKLRKLELAKKVSAKLKPDTKYPKEVEEKLFALIDKMKK